MWYLNLKTNLPSNWTVFVLFKKKKIVAHIRLNGVIGHAGKFKQGIDFAGQEDIIKKAFSLIESLVALFVLSMITLVFINSSFCICATELGLFNISLKFNRDSSVNPWV